VVELFGAGAVGTDVAAVPAAAEVVTASGQFADQVMKILIVRVAASFGVQDGDAGVGGEVPIGVEVVGGVEVQEGEPDEVRHGLPGGFVDGGVHGPAEVVGGQ
jgi:hypothetical protein